MNKEEKERSTFETFLRLSGKSFDSFEAGTPPEPDIVALRGDQKFGVEITSFHHEGERSREGEQDKTMDLACSYYEADGGPCLDVSVMWTPHFKLVRKDRDRLARQIAALARTKAPAARSWITLDWADLGTDLIEVINHITINRLVEYERNHWHSARAAFVPDSEVPFIQKIIDRKNAKPENYRAHYSERWLLLVSEFGYPSSWFETTDTVRDTLYESVFERVFLLSSFPFKVFELQVRR